MTQFKDGQEVEVDYVGWYHGTAARMWRRARIVSFKGSDIWAPDEWLIKFPDGTRAVFNTEHIRPCAKASER